MEALPLANGCPEHVKGVLSSSAGYYARHSTPETRFFDKFPEPFAAADMQFLTVTAPLYIDAYFYHRVPPIHPASKVRQGGIVSARPRASFCWGAP